MSETPREFPLIAALTGTQRACGTGPIRQNMVGSYDPLVSYHVFLFRFLNGLGLAVGLVACSSHAPQPTPPHSIAVGHYRGVPPSAVTPSAVPTPQEPPGVPAGGVAAAWRNGRLELAIWGSGSCPAVPTGVKARGQHAIEVTISEDYGNGPCTADLGPTTSIIDVPDEIAEADPLTVTVRGKNRRPVTIDLPRQ